MCLIESLWQIGKTKRDSATFVRLTHRAARPYSFILSPVPYPS